MKLRVSVPRAVASGSRDSLTFKVSIIALSQQHLLIRSLPLAVMTRNERNLRMNSSL